MLNFIQILQLVSFAFLMSLGQILFKKTALSMSTLGALSLIDGIMKAIFIPWLYLALTVYALATVFWLYILQRIPLTIAYPFSALAMIIVPILAVILFGEKLSIWVLVALLPLFMGVFFVNLRAKV